MLPDLCTCSPKSWKKLLHLLLWVGGVRCRECYSTNLLNAFFLSIFCLRMCELMGQKTQLFTICLHCYSCTWLGCLFIIYLTLKVLVATIDAQWEGMGDVGSPRYEPALLPPCPTIRVLSYSNK